MPEKFEREIDEILNKMDNFPRGAPHKRRNPNQLGRRVGDWQRAWAVRLAHISSGQLMLGSLGLMLFSFMFRGIFGRLWVYGFTLGLILFFTAFLLSFVGPGHVGGAEPYFRGRPRSAYQPAAQPLSARFKEWWRRRRAGP